MAGLLLRKLPWAWLGAFLAMAAMATASQPFSIAPNDNSTQFNDTASQTVLSYADSSGQTGLLSIAPLRGQTANFPTVPVSLLLSPSNAGVIPVNSTTILYFSCDAADYPQLDIGSPASLYHQVGALDAAAILLYSRTSPGCNIVGDPQPSDYDRVWTLTSAVNANHLISEDNATTMPMIATIGPQAILNYTAFSNITAQFANTVTHTYSPSLNTQVAMIILYTVTGLVSALFLVIIALGAIRAHRHPERYGPRAARRGRTHQSRAGGLARAMLDSLPIVKFGSPEPPKQADVELGDGSPQLDTVRSESAPTLAKDGSENSTPKQSPDSSPELDRSSIRSGIGPAAVGGQGQDTQTGEAPSCSICTDDFEAGQDMRVLPCDHKFHPACIDPWLVNVSGTCPMCRIDLNPARSSADSSTHSDWDGHIYHPDSSVSDSADQTDATPDVAPNRASRLRQRFLQRVRRQTAEQNPSVVNDAELEATSELSHGPPVAAPSTGQDHHPAEQPHQPNEL